ncbi:DnaJ- protein scj1, partial [Dimargaris xerosporica]
QETRGPDLHIPLEVTLAELYMGHTIEYDVSKQVLCEHCHGSGAESPDDITTCTSCKGQGIKVVQQMLMPGFYQTMQSPCDVCSGTGKVIGTKCSRCHGNKVERANEPLTVEIAAGMPDRHRIAFERHADHSPEWDVPGSVVFHLRTRPHPRFTRDGNDLHLNYTISLLQALSGFETSFTHLDKTTRVDLKRPNVVTPPGFVQKVKGQGMPLFDEHAGLFTEGAGDLYVHYVVEFPESVSSANRVILKTVLSATVKASNAIHDEL